MANAVLITKEKPEIGINEFPLEGLGAGAEDGPHPDPHPAEVTGAVTQT